MLDEDARRLRQRRTAVVGTTVACLAAVAVPVLADGLDDSGNADPLLRRPAETQTPSPMPTPAIPAPADYTCRAPDDLTRGLPDGTATWIRLCPNHDGWVFTASETGPPDQILTEDVDLLVDFWIDGDYSSSCPGPVAGDRFFAQVGFDDGTVREMVLAPGSCRTAVLGGQPIAAPSREVFATLLERLGALLSAGGPDTSGDPAPDCPQAPRDVANDAGTPPPHAGYLIPLPARATVLCRYEADAGGTDTLALVDSTELTAAEGERLRVAYHSRNGGTVDCATDSSEPVYSVLMRDATGTLRTVTVDLAMCGTIATDFGDAGWASPWLVEELSAAWAAHQEG